MFVTSSNQVGDTSLPSTIRVDDIVSGSSVRCLNVVLDLNGVLCSCEPSWAAKGCRNTDFSVHSSTLGTVVSTKIVKVRPGCAEFLRELSTFANVTIWSSMMRNTTARICDYLFHTCPIKPLRILGQEDCDRIVDRVSGHRTYYKKEEGTQKDIFLKTLSKHLFNNHNGLYTASNTVIVDDSPIKNMLNSSENVLLVHSWPAGVEDAEKDSTLLEIVLPYFREMSRSNSNLKEFRDSHGLGRPMLYEDRKTYTLYKALCSAIESSRIRAR